MEPTPPTTTPPTSTQEPASSSGSKRGTVLRRVFLLSVILLAVLTIGAVVYEKFFNSNDANTQQPQTLVVSEAQVTITKDGFIPASITIAQGTQITWTNTDSEPHQVAADPYPKNDSIPGFDSTIILQQDESFSFTFEQPGTYTYHDELKPMTLKGTVVVE